MLLQLALNMTLYLTKIEFYFNCAWMSCLMSALLEFTFGSTYLHWTFTNSVSNQYTHFDIRVFAFRPYFIVGKKYTISSQNRLSERSISQVWESYISIDQNELMSLCQYVCTCVCLCVHAHTNTLLEVAVFIKLLFNIYTFVGLGIKRY